MLVVAGEEYRGDGLDHTVPVLRFSGLWSSQTATIVHALQSHSVDLVNLQYSPPMYTTRFKFAWQQIASHFVSTVSFHTLWGGQKLNHLMALRLLHGADGIIATNSEIMYLVQKYTPFFLKKVYGIPIGANIEPTSGRCDAGAIATKYALPPDAVVLAYFGMAYPGKGMQLLFEAIRILVDAYQRDFRLLIIGGGMSDDAAYRDENKQLMAKLDITGKVMWTGQIPAPEVSELLSRSGMVILPFDAGVSDRRGSLLAALAHRKAVVTTAPTIPVPLFKNGANMLWPLCPGVDAFAAAILRVLRDDDLRRQLESGAADLARHFTWSHIANQTQACFREVIAKTRGAKQQSVRPR